MEKNEKITIKITDMTNEGAGFGRLADGGLAIFVAGAIPGDAVTAEITKLKKNFAEAKLVQILEPSSDRITPACPYFGQCGGCSLLNMNYEAQLRLKSTQVRDKLERIGEIENLVIRPIIGMDNPYKYRNKAEYPAYAGPDKSLIGFYGRASHKIIDVKECLIQTKASDLISGVIRKYNKGEIRSAVVKTAFGTGDVMVILSCDPDKTKYLESMIYEMDDVLASDGDEVGLESVWAENNGKYKFIAGKRTITDSVDFYMGPGTVAKKDFEISAQSFYQVNHEQMKKLYAVAAEYAGLDGTQTVLDLYCGIGTIGLSMAEKAQKIIGVEIVKEAVIDANRNAVINGIVNARYICGKAEEVLPLCAGAYQVSSANQPGETLDSTNDAIPVFDELSGEAYLADALANDEIVAILDPPRAGCDEKLLSVLAESSINRIVYISCDPASLARDIKYLQANGCKFIEATPVDMFPQTMHVETVVLLRREKPSAYVDIDVDIDELVSLEGGNATYTDIKSYVKNNYGFEVSSLYIAQIKDKCGIKERLNHNKGNNLNRVPICPIEKEKAIIEAFKYFKLI